MKDNGWEGLNLHLRVRRTRVTIYTVRHQESVGPRVRRIFIHIRLGIYSILPDKSTLITRSRNG